MKRSSYFGFLFVIFCLLGASSCAALLIYDIYFVQNSRAGLHKAGTLINKKDQVRRKYGNSFMWDRITAKDDIYWSDAIQTAEKSQGTLQFEDGTQFLLRESSLISIDEANGELAVNLRDGSFAVDTSKVIGKSELLVNGSRLPIGISADKKMSIEVDSKTGNLSTYRTSKYGTTWKSTFDKSGRVLKDTPVPVSLKFPQADERVCSLQQRLPITLSWKTLTPINSIIEVSSDRTYKKLFLRQIRRVNEPTEILVNLPAGSFYWRVRYLEGKGTSSSETRRLIVDKPNKFNKNSCLVAMKPPPPVAPPKPIVIAKPIVKPKRKIASAPKPIVIPPPSEETTWTIKVVLFESEDDASKLVNELRDKGLSTFYSVQNEKDKNYFVVNVGLFNGKSDGESFMNRHLSQLKINSGKGLPIVVKSE